MGLFRVSEPAEPWNDGVAVGEDPAVAGHEPVAAAVRRRGHPHDRLVERKRAGRAVKRCVAITEDAPVVGHQPVAAAIGRRGHPDDGTRGAGQTDRRHEELPGGATRVVGAAGRTILPGRVVEPPVPVGVREERSTPWTEDRPVCGQDLALRAAGAEGPAAGGDRGGVAGTRVHARGEREIEAPTGRLHGGVLHRRLPGIADGVVREQEAGARTGGEPGAARVQLLGPDVGRRRRTPVVLLPHEIGDTGAGVDEGLGVDRAHGLTLDRAVGDVVEHHAGGRDGGGGRHGEAVEPGVRPVPRLGRVVEHHPMPGVLEHAGRRLGVRLFPGRWVRQSRRAVAGVRGLRVGPVARMGRRRDQRRDVVPEGVAGRERVVDAGRVDDLGIGRVAAPGVVVGRCPGSTARGDERRCGARTHGDGMGRCDGRNRNRLRLRHLRNGCSCSQEQHADPRSRHDLDGPPHDPLACIQDPR